MARARSRPASPDEAKNPSNVACSLERVRVTSCKADRSSLAQTRSSFFQGTGQETRPVVKGSGEPEPAATPAAPAVLQAGSAAAPAPLPGDGAAAVPKWFPGWAREFAEQYYAGSTCLFIFHGNVHDLVRQEESKPGTYGSVPDFLATQLFGTWDIVLIHDLSYGLRMAAGTNRERLRKMFGPVSERIGEPKTWPKDPDAILALLDQLFQKNVMEDDPVRRVNVGVIFDQAQYLMPTSELSQMAGPQGSRLVRLLSWAQSPYIKRSNIAVCLL